MVDKLDVRPQAEAIATSVADRCQGTRPKGAAPQRYALIWQAARLGAIDALTAALPTPTEDARERVKVLEEALGELRREAWFIIGVNHPAIVKADTALGNKETDRHG